jgi:uracil-DNA glycosylase family 4
MNKFKDPDRNCALCKRLVDYRETNREKFPEKFNAPVPSLGNFDAELLIAGLAPGLKGANFTGRPFTGDYAGNLLYKTLLKHSFAKGTYHSSGNDNVVLINCRITNVVRCVPPQNKPTTEETKNCQPFLDQELEEMKSLKVILCLGKVSHDAILRNMKIQLSLYPFGHNKVHKISEELTIVDSYHCSRYNTQTGRLTEEMFGDVFKTIKELLAFSN